MESEYINRTGQLKEYMKLHIISLEQDMDKHEATDTLLVEYLEGSIETAKHLLSVAEDILG